MDSGKNKVANAAQHNLHCTAGGHSRPCPHGMSSVQNTNTFHRILARWSWRRWDSARPNGLQCFLHADNAHRVPAHPDQPLFSSPTCANPKQAWGGPEAWFDPSRSNKHQAVPGTKASLFPTMSQSTPMSTGARLNKRKRYVLFSVDFELCLSLNTRRCRRRAMDATYIGGTGDDWSLPRSKMCAAWSGTRSKRPTPLHRDAVLRPPDTNALNTTV